MSEWRSKRWWLRMKCAGGWIIATLLLSLMFSSPPGVQWTSYTQGGLVGIAAMLVYKELCERKGIKPW